MQFPWWMVACAHAWLIVTVVSFATGWFWVGIAMLAIFAIGLFTLLAAYGRGMSR